MLNSDIILGLKTRLGHHDYGHAILTQSYKNWPCGVPVVYPRIKTDGAGIAVATLIAPSQTADGTDLLNVPRTIVHEVDLLNLSENHKIITASEFDISKLDRLLEFVHDVGAISLIIEYKPGRIKSIEALQKLENKFKCSNLFHKNYWPDQTLNGSDDRYLNVLTFLDLPYCVPLFNMRKVDGIGLSFSGVTAKASISYCQLHRVFRCDFIYSNYMENVFVIDGVSINGQIYGPELYPELVKLVDVDLPIQNDPPGKADKCLAKNTAIKNTAIGYGYATTGNSIVVNHSQIGETWTKADQIVEEQHMEWKTTPAETPMDVRIEPPPVEATMHIGIELTKAETDEIEVEVETKTKAKKAGAAPGGYFANYTQPYNRSNDSGSSDD